jgi:hypothetical protein
MAALHCLPLPPPRPPPLPLACLCSPSRSFSACSVCVLRGLSCTARTTDWLLLPCCHQLRWLQSAPLPLVRGGGVINKAPAPLRRVGSRCAGCFPRTGGGAPFSSRLCLSSPLLSPAVVCCFGSSSGTSRRGHELRSTHHSPDTAPPLILSSVYSQPSASHLLVCHSGARCVWCTRHWGWWLMAGNCKIPSLVQCQ